MKLLKDDLVFQIVHTDNTHYFVVVLAEQEPPSTSVPVPRTHTGKIPLSELQRDLQTIELALEDKQAERQSLTRWITLIAQNLADNEDAVALKVADSLSLDDKELFVIQAWVPVKKICEFESFAKNNEWSYDRGYTGGRPASYVTGKLPNFWRVVRRSLSFIKHRLMQTGIPLSYCFFLSLFSLP